MSGARTFDREIAKRNQQQKVETLRPSSTYGFFVPSGSSVYVTVSSEPRRALTEQERKAQWGESLDGSDDWYCPGGGLG